MHATSCALNFGRPACNCKRPDARIVRPEPYGGFVAKSTGTPLWARVRMRARVIFMTDRTSHEMALVFEALQDANLRIEELEKARDHRHNLEGSRTGPPQ